MAVIKACPVKTAIKYIGKRWTVEIIRDMMFGKTRFKEFLAANPKLSPKVLAQRLKELEENNIAQRLSYAKSNRVEYHLTPKGSRLNRVLYELALFSYEFYQDEIFESRVLDIDEFRGWATKYLKLQVVE